VIDVERARWVRDIGTADGRVGVSRSSQTSWRRSVRLALSNVGLAFGTNLAVNSLTSVNDQEDLWGESLSSDTIRS
jgi:hypothetical protein